MSNSLKPRGSLSIRAPLPISSIIVFTLLVGLVGVSERSAAQQNPDPGDAEIEVLHVQGNVYMLVGAGGAGNVTLQVGNEGVLVVDTMSAELSEKVLAAIRTVSTKPLRYIINTSVHPDHAGGNAAVATAGQRVVGGNINMDLEFTTQDAEIIAHESVLHHMSEQDPRPPVEAWPTSTYFTGRKDIVFNGEAIRILHQPNALTDGDSIVYFRGSDVISAGKIFNTTGYPYIDVQRGGSINGIIDALNRMIDLSVPAGYQEGGTMVIPAHGRITDEFEVVEYRDMLTIIRDRIQALIDDGMSLPEVQTFRPTVGYDARYGAGLWPTEQFVEAVYRELSDGRTISGGIQ